MAPGDRWPDQTAGPFVRPYAVTMGRTASASGERIDLIDVMVADIDPRTVPGLRLSAEHRRLLARCQRPITVVDLASDIDLPVAVVRVLLGDLTEQGVVRVVRTRQGPTTSMRVLKEVLDGLQAL